MPRIAIKPVSLGAAVFLICVLWTCLTCGCGGKGWAPLWSQASPETYIETDPARGVLKYYDSTGKEFAADELDAQFNGARLSAKGIKTKDHSVDNREANVNQMAQANEITKTVGKTVTDSIALGVQLADVIRTPKDQMIDREHPPLWRSPWAIVVPAIVALAWIFRKRLGAD